MVLRQPDDDSSLPQALPPYPTTPSEASAPAASHGGYFPDQNRSPAFHLKTPDQAHTDKPKDDTDSDFTEDEWNQSDDDFEELRPQEVPSTLKPGGGKQPVAGNAGALPNALRAGPSAGIPIPTRKPLDKTSSALTGPSTASSLSNVSERSNGSMPLQTNNPYLKMQPTGQSSWGAENSQAIWGDAHGQPQNREHDEPAELPAQTPVLPSHQLQHLTLGNEASNRPRTQSIDQPPLIAVDSPTPRTAHPKDSIVNPWAPVVDVSSLDAGARAYGLPEDSQHYNGQRTWQEQQAWEQSGRERRQKEAHAAQEAAIRAEQERNHEEEFYRLEQQSQMPKVPPPPIPPLHGENPPVLPPRTSQAEQPSTRAPLPIDTGVGGPSAVPGPESPNTVMNRQRKEHYQIKQIRWFDYNKSGIRTSPILTQNLNGPCPLLALVNALVLSTPAGIETALVETLRTRETVSLGLLLDAVFDELMSGRRGDAAQTLPDVGELYKFLLALHTGLNVNPMFVPETDVHTGNTSLTNLAGAFENTKDMKLYRTFDIPLMHGWLPESASEAYLAFDRVAKSYETSQYVQFQEEELEAKLASSEPLTTDEQQMFTDIHAIKEFLDRWPTQLTDHGLKVMRNVLHDGQFAILFRNDHFSTLCKDPRTGKLVTLVTDQGYSSHEEIVWESLTDVNGQGSQLFSGDFRSVDNSNMSSRTEEQQIQSLINAEDDRGWSTVQSRRGNQQQLPSSSAEPSADATSSELASRAEQEDHDLALALQLQEEEEDRQRREQENQLSRNAVTAQSGPRPGNPPRRGDQAPTIPPRRNNITTHRPSNEPAPPPTYEEASTAPRYNPPPGHPASAQAPLLQPGSAYQSNNGGLPPPGPGRRPNSGRPMQPPNALPARPGRRYSGGPGTMGGPGGPDERDKCVVM